LFLPSSGKRKVASTVMGIVKNRAVNGLGAPKEKPLPAIFLLHRSVIPTSWGSYDAAI
jgi:hypothetical protein